MTPANIADLQRLWSHLDVWQEQAKACTTATVIATLSIHPGGRGASATLSLVSDKTGGHDVHEPIDYVEEIEQALKRFKAHFDGFMSEQPKPVPAPLVCAAGLVWGIKDPNIEGRALWGCRAILDERGAKPFVDILWDRQSMIGEAEAQTALHARLNGDDGNPGALPAFRRLVAEGEIETAEPIASSTVNGVEFFHHASGGYLYITTRRTPCRQCGKPVPSAGWLTCGNSECQRQESMANATRAKAPKAKRSRKVVR